MVSKCWIALTLWYSRKRYKTCPQVQWGEERREKELTARYLSVQDVNILCPWAETWLGYWQRYPQGEFDGVTRVQTRCSPQFIVVKRKKNPKQTESPDETEQMENKALYNMYKCQEKMNDMKSLQGGCWLRSVIRFHVKSSSANFSLLFCCCKLLDGRPAAIWISSSGFEAI